MNTIFTKNRHNIPFSTFFTKRAVLLYFLALIAVTFLPRFNTFPFHWLVFGIIEFSSFFYYTSLLSREWGSYSEKFFLKKIFKTALAIRIIYVIFIYFFYIWMTGSPFEFEAGDACFYDNFGASIADGGLLNAFDIGAKSHISISDMGYPIIIGLIYSIFGKIIIIPRIINALLSAWMCLFIYRITNRHFGENTARLAAIISMLLPHFIYYCGLHLKETTMLFLLMLFIERIDFVLKDNKLNMKQLFPSLAIGMSLFLFRNVLGMSAWLGFFSVLIFTTERLVGWSKRIVIVFFVSIVVAFFMSGRIEEEISSNWKDREKTQIQNMNFRSVRKDGNKYAKYGSAAMFAPVILIVPITTIANLTDQQNTMLINGNLFVKNVMAFFLLVTLYVIFFRDKTYRQHSLLLAVYFIYLIILAFSSFAISERFHLPIMPFFVIFVAYGITQTKGKIARYYVPYLVLLGLIIFVWNVFKLIGKGYMSNF